MKENYLVNMADARSAHAHRKAAAIAKKNAESWVVGLGIGGIGAGIGTQKIKSPLSMFSGPAFIDALRGAPSTVPQKRSRNDDDYDADNEPRNGREQGLKEDNILQDDDTAMVLDDEVGKTPYISMAVCLRQSRASK